MNSAEAFMIVGTTLAVFAVAAIAVWQIFRTWQVYITNKAAVERDHAFEVLADKAVYTQQKLLEQQERMLGELDDLRNRVVGIEQMLKQVE